MSKLPLDYRGTDPGESPKPQVRWQTVVSGSLLGMAIVCGIVALAWPPRRAELISAAITLAIAGVLIYFPYIRT